MSVLAALREATAPLHGALERDLDILARLATTAGRRDVLGGFLGAYEPAERTLLPLLAPVVGLDYSARLKAPRLRACLAELGMSAPAVDALPRLGAPQLAGRDASLGFAYVLEGATLGGRIIRRQALAAGQTEAGLGFFDLYGPDTGPRWQAFCAVLETGEPEPVVAGALMGFGYVRAGLLESAAAA